MKKKYWSIIYGSIIIIFFICCFINQSHSSVSTNPHDKQTISSEQFLIEIPYQLWIEENNYCLNLYEPIEGCYIGAYILANKYVDFDIQEFEKKVQKPHSTYMYNLKLGEPFPLDWVLDCTSQMKVPHIIIHPPSHLFPYQEHLLEQTSKEFGEFFIPMFVQLYPNFTDYMGSPSEYKNFFQTASRIFKKNAPNVSIVWSLPVENLYHSFLYDPGDVSMDWIGIHVNISTKEQEKNNNKDILQSIYDFYITYQHRKPLMISQLEIAHYSTKNHSYYINETKTILKEIYDKIKTMYPRIKAIQYMNTYQKEINSLNHTYENFSITEQPEILDTYKNLIASSHYLENIDVQSNGEVYPQWILLDTPIYYLNEKLYVSDYFFAQPYIQTKFNNLVKKPIIIKNQKLYSLESICKDIGYKLKMNQRKNCIYLTFDRS
ncbi:MAG: hypothetical protein GX347_03870 [Epulopiscium sp.]|nr:hypothetical protein [Candidatus Epulonipiscium sp.]